FLSSLRVCISVFCVRISSRLPLLSTLFPYTTLFRSLGRVDIDHVSAGQELVERDVNDGLAGAFLRDGVQRIGVLARRRAGAAVQDRKSTRLNSSHVSISYAVFCLKKKINALFELYST